MALTHNFNQTVSARVRNDPVFALALLDEAIILIVNGEPGTAKLLLREILDAADHFGSQTLLNTIRESLSRK